MASQTFFELRQPDFLRGLAGIDQVEPVNHGVADISAVKIWYLSSIFPPLGWSEVAVDHR